MTWVSALARALGIGLLVAAPVGAMALLCVQRTFAGGRAQGYATGAGIATADALYASVAAFGLTAVTSALTGAQGWVRVIGGLFLVYLGLRAVLTRPCRTDGAGQRTQTVAAAYGSAVLLTLANPQTIITFAGVFAGAGLAVAGRGWWMPAVTVAGVLAGSLGWWLVLVTVVGALRGRTGDAVLLWVSRVSGAAIAILGVLAFREGLLLLIR